MRRICIASDHMQRRCLAATAFLPPVGRVEATASAAHSNTAIRIFHSGRPPPPLQCMCHRRRCQLPHHTHHTHTHTHSHTIYTTYTCAFTQMRHPNTPVVGTNRHKRRCTHTIHDQFARVHRNEMVASTQQ